MNKAIRFISTLAVAVSVTNLASADDKAKKPAADEMMKKMEAAGTPGAAHKVLEPLIGNWNAEVKIFMDPTAAPTVNKATAKAEWTLKGRFLREQFHGEFMGKSFEGLSLIGYDNTSKQYKYLWVDDMHTSMFVSEGEASQDGKILNFGGTYDCPMTGEKKTSKVVLRIIDRNKHIFEMHDPSLGEKSKTMEITYTRK